MATSTNWKRLFAAGCVVGILSGISVHAEANALAPMGEEYGGEYENMAYEDEAQDAFAPAEEMMPEEMMPEEMMPEEEMSDEAMAPDAGPDPQVLKELGYDATQGIDYIPGPTKIAVVGDVSAQMVGSAEECAEACTAEPLCNIAAYYTPAKPDGSNCFLKGLDPGCTVPQDTDPAPDAWLLVSDSKCEVEVKAPAPSAVAPEAEAPTPVSAVAGKYTRHEGYDYIPSSVSNLAPNLVTVKDIGTGLLVGDVAECEAACDAAPACNAAAYLNTILPESEKNCYLKTMGNACALPADAAKEPATLSLKCDAGGLTGGLTAAPPASSADPPAGEFATPPGAEETGTTSAGTTSTETTRDGDLATTTPSGSAEVAPGNGVASVCTGLAAVAFAGAVAML